MAAYPRAIQPGHGLSLTESLGARRGHTGDPCPPRPHSSIPYLTHVQLEDAPLPLCVVGHLPMAPPCHPGPIPLLLQPGPRSRGKMGLSLSPSRSLHPLSATDTDQDRPTQEALPCARRKEGLGTTVDRAASCTGEDRRQIRAMPRAVRQKNGGPDPIGTAYKGMAVPEVDWAGDKGPCESSNKAILRDLCSRSWCRAQRGGPDHAGATLNFLVLFFFPNERVPICWFTSQIPTTAGAGPTQSRKLTTEPRFPT